MTDHSMTHEYQRNVSDFVRNNVVCCVSSLFSDVHTLVRNADRNTLQGTSFDDDEMMDLQQRKNYEEPAKEHIKDMDRDDLITALDDRSVKDHRPSNEIGVAAMETLLKAIEEGDFDPAVDGSIEEGAFARMDQWPGISDNDLRDRLEADIGDEDDWESFCDDQGVEPEYDEVYEHWVVDRWFAARLAEHGEITGDFGGLTVWGRTTTGQAISLDYVVCRIYDELHQQHEDQSK